MELCLGTVQFGMDYGVFNQPKKDVNYCISCLDYATQNGISAIDTAAAYGTAEEVTGQFIRKKQFLEINYGLAQSVCRIFWTSVLRRIMKESLKLI